MKDKLSYYDFLADFVPGTLFIVLVYLFTAEARVKITLPSLNVVSDSLIFIVLAFVAGHFIQYFSKYTIEQIGKRVFWKGYFFSQWFLVKGSRCCADLQRAHYVNVAKENFGFSDSTLASLEVEDINTADNQALDKARNVSQAVYRRFDAYAFDKNIGGKALIQNTFYSFFRGLTLVSALGFIAFATLAYEICSTYHGVLALGHLLAILAFFHRMKERGELYIRGLFDSVAAHVVAERQR